MISKDIKKAIDNVIYALYEDNDDLKSILKKPMMIIEEADLGTLTTKEIRDIVKYIDLDFSVYNEDDDDENDEDEDEDDNYTPTDDGNSINDAFDQDSDFINANLGWD